MRGRKTDVETDGGDVGTLGPVYQNIVFSVTDWKCDSLLHRKINWSTSSQYPSVCPTSPTIPSSFLHCCQRDLHTPHVAFHLFRVRRTTLNFFLTNLNNRHSQPELLRMSAICICLVWVRERGVWKRQGWGGGTEMGGRSLWSF